MTDLQCLPYGNDSYKSQYYGGWNDSYNVILAVMWPFEKCPTGGHVNPLITHTDTFTHTHVWLFNFNRVAVNLLWMMSKCIKKKRWVVSASVLTPPLCNLGGIYTKVAHVDPLTTQTFLSPTPLCSTCSVCSHRYSVLCSVSTPPQPPSSYPV